MVETEPRKGFRVAAITESELRDITGVRATIESLCLENAIRHGDLKWETGIVSTLFELSRLQLQDANDPARVSEAWAETHQRFHKALVAACDSPWLLKLRETLFMQSERYRRISVPLDRVGRDIQGEHKRIADAAIDRNVELACSELRDHLEKTTRILIKADVVNQQRVGAPA